jgi:GDP/UDP-N,N'-diacetylbacillosamine 2-epimerase (hydrolysing)
MSVLIPLILKMRINKKIEPLLFVGGTHLKKKYGKTINEIFDYKLKINRTFDYINQGDTDLNLSQSFINAQKQISNIFRDFKFEYVCVLGDRFEKLSVVNNAIIFKKPIIHLHGGERTEGVIDEQVRHMITKSAHIHFAIHESYKKNIISMGEQKFRVHNSGSLAIDLIKKIKKIKKIDIYKKFKLEKNKDFIILNYHPVTLENTNDEKKKITNIINVLKKFNLQVLITAPGHEQGSYEIFRLIKILTSKDRRFTFIPSIGSKFLFNLIPYSKFMIGNSSSAIIESPYFKIPSINIGNRQKGRFFHENIINVDYKKKNIKKAIDLALSKKFRLKIKKMRYLFGKGKSSNKIIKILLRTKLDKKLIQKRLEF